MVKEREKAGPTLLGRLNQSASLTHYLSTNGAAVTNDESNGNSAC